MTNKDVKLGQIPMNDFKGGVDFLLESKHEHFGYDNEKMVPIQLLGKVLHVPKSMHYYFQKIARIFRVVTADDVLTAILDVVIEKNLKLRFFITGFDYMASGEYDLAIMHELYMLPL